MTDLNKLRSEFESNEYIKSIIQNFEWSEEFNNYQIKDCVINGNIFDLLEAKNDEQLLNGAWFGWQEKAKAQAVQQSFEIGRLQDRITELLDERQDLYAQINNDQAVPDTQQKLTDTYYLEGSDYVVDCPFEYDIEIDKGEVLELQKWQRTESTKVYFANIYKDEDNFEILQFASKAEAENAVAENLKFLEASESGAEQ
ncbi:hypothetical protein ACEPKG_000593 [Acinetobacter baumannii]